MQEITVDTSRVLKRFDRRPIGINLDYLVDSNANRPQARPIEEALREMQVRWLRYPGGGKSDRHLWSLPPFEKPAPQVFGPYREYSAGSAIMDFDEYMGIVRAVGAEPFVVVGYKLEKDTTISRATYLRNAVEWVRYANVRKGYNVRYWEIGNENWLNDQMPPEHMAEVVAEFAPAMKAVDPTIQIGSNGFGRNWWSGFLPKAAPHLDFLTLSVYPCSTWMGYDYYRANPEVALIEQVEIADAAIAALPAPADRERLSIILTELNSMDYAKDGWPNRNNLGHALVTTELFGRAIAHPRVRAAMLWNTRWVQPEPDTIWYGLGRANEILPSGRAVAVWGQFVGDALVAVDRTPSIVTFATTSSGAVTVLLINKGLTDEPVRLRINAAGPLGKAVAWRFCGTGPDDMQPVWQQLPEPAVGADASLELSLPGVSLTVLSLTAR